MNTYAERIPLPRVKVRERASTGGKWFMDNIWRKCLFFVRCSNAWPYEILGGRPWQHRNPAPEVDA